MKCSHAAIDSALAPPQSAAFYETETLVTMGETNAMGNVYFAEYFALQGVTRERWVAECVPGAKELLSAGMILSTKSAHCDFKKPFYLFDKILCRMHIEELQRVSARLVFEYVHSATMEVHATGWQIVVFKDADRKTCRMPDDFRRAGLRIFQPRALRVLR